MTHIHHPACPPSPHDLQCLHLQNWLHARHCRLAHSNSEQSLLQKLVLEAECEALGQRLSKILSRNG